MSFAREIALKNHDSVSRLTENENHLEYWLKIISSSSFPVLQKQILLGQTMNRSGWFLSSGMFPKKLRKVFPKPSLETNKC